MQPIRVTYAESETANSQPGNLKFCVPFVETTLMGRNPQQRRGKEQIKQKSKLHKVELQNVELQKL